MGQRFLSQLYAVWTRIRWRSWVKIGGKLSRAEAEHLIAAFRSKDKTDGETLILPEGELPVTKARPGNGQ